MLRSQRGPRKELPLLTSRRPLGTRGLQVSPICLGRVEHPSVVPAAFDAGINFFFITTDMHWPYYEGLRAGLIDLFKRRSSIREEVVVATVSYVSREEFWESPFEETLDSLPGLQHLDVSVAGGTYADSFADRRRAFKTHKHEEKMGARAFGASFHQRTEALRAINAAEVDVAFVRYSARYRGAERDFFPALEDSPACPVYAFKTSMGWIPPRAFPRLGIPDDVWAPGRTDAYRFALSRPELDGLLVSLDTPQQVEDLAAALASGPLSDEESEFMRTLADVFSGDAKVVPG